jgi:uncharacterized protein (TIGR00159 family)
MPAFITISALDVVDILLVALLLYELYNLVKGSVAINIFFGIVGIFFIWRITDVLHMDLLREILGAFFSLGFIALIIIFQPEIRQFLFAFGKPGFINNKKRRFLFWKINDLPGFEIDIDKIVQACQKMANIKQGALIVLTRQNELRPILDTGQAINADLTVELLENIFYPNSPLHDGAVLITGNKIKAAKCILPVSKNSTLAASIGLRHRAALGVTEQSDAVAVIVSEQSGKISYAKEGKLSRNVSLIDLQDFLNEEFGMELNPAIVSPSL